MNRTASLVLLFSVLLGGCVSRETEQPAEIHLRTFYVDTPDSFERAQAQACRDARMDFTHGVPRWIVCGIRTLQAEKVGAFLSKRFGITPEFRGCVASTTDEEYARTYNEMVRLLFQTERDINLAAECNTFWEKEKGKEAEPVDTANHDSAG